MYSPTVKLAAYRLDPECWASYSGKPVRVKQQMELRRNAALHLAQAVEDDIAQDERPSMTPLKLNLLLHFYAVVGPYPHEQTRRSDAYVDAVRAMLRDGLIERPSLSDRRQHPGWAYRTTDKGRVYVEGIMQAVRRVPLPVPSKPVWTIPHA